MSSGKIVCEIYFALRYFLRGGFRGSVPEGIRTHDLTDANRTLSQLSYVPMKISP